MRQPADHHPKLSPELVEASIEAAVTSISLKRNNQVLSYKSETRTAATEEDSNKNLSKMSIDKLIPLKKPRRKRAPQVKLGQSAGRWTHAEHQAFLEGMKECGREWKKVAIRIPTRTSAQIRSHAQKHFSKLQRDQDSMVFHPDSGHRHHHYHHGACGAASSAIPADGSHPIQPSVRQNVDRILANPQAVQREVEDTLDALRERYRQLQLRLSNNATRARVVEDDRSNASSRKRVLDEAMENRNNTNSNNNNRSSDDHSSDCSMASVASIMSSIAARDLGDEELIALSVLGGALPRGDSSTYDDHPSHRESPPPDAARSSSEDTSVASSNNEQEEEQGDNHHYTVEEEASRSKRQKRNED
jgi:SHAQKYF class myb-like DNA-binding protein